MARRRISIVPVLLVNFIGTLGFSIVLPFLIFLVLRFDGNPLLYGFLAATYPAMQLIGAPILGKWSDVVGRRKVLLLSQAGTLLSWIVFAAALFLPKSVLLESGTLVLTLPLVVLFAARALDGITGGNISVANAYLADITEEEQRTRNFGRMAVSSNLGFIAGPMLAGMLGATVYGEVIPVFAAMGISLMATVVIFFWLPESKPCVMKQAVGHSTVRLVLGQELKECYELQEAGPIKLKDALMQKGIPFLLSMYFVIYLGFSIFYTAFPLHASGGLKWTVTDTGGFFAVLSFLMVIVQGPVVSRLSKRCSDAFMIIVGTAILGTSFLLMTFPQKWVVFTAAVPFALGNGLMWTSFLSTLSKAAGERYQGAIQGFGGSVGSAASIIGLIGGGLLYGILGADTFFVSAGIIFLCFLMSFRLPGLQRRTDLPQ